ncbi:MAG: FMN-binding protein [Phycisphaerales bacterium]|nr:MAG: FMN-binding protein [Phycisphaerales bacterium]
MSQMILKLRLLMAVVAGLAILAAGYGCAGSASTSTRAARIDMVCEVFPSAVELVEVMADGKAEGRSGIAVVNEVRSSSNLLGYLVETRVTGRSGPFKIAVLLDGRLIVKRATVISYPWPRGREVGKRSFTRQFEGKGPEDTIEIGKDIDAVTGATISCRAMATGVREAIELLAD